MEQQIKLAAKIYKCRDTAKQLYGEEYPEKIGQYMDIIRGHMKKHGGNELEAVIALSKEVEGNSYAGTMIMRLTAAAAELLEPSSKTPSI